MTRLLTCVHTSQFLCFMDGFSGYNHVDVFVTLECIHLYILCLVPRCLFREVSVMYLSHVMPRCSIERFNNLNNSCQVIVGNPPIVQGLNFPAVAGP